MPMSDQKIIAMIPARIGSTRLKMKNLALLDGRPLISYSINAAKNSEIFDEIVINSDSSVFTEIAEREEVGFYLRPPSLGSSETKSDEVVADFLGNHPCDIIVWVNPIAPLQTGAEIRNIVRNFIDRRLETLHTVKSEQVHCNYNQRPLNYTERELFAKTQDLIPVEAFVYTVMMWRAESFLENYSRNGFAMISGKTGFFTVTGTSSIIIKNDVDLKLAEFMMQAKSSMQKGDLNIQYDPIVETIKND